MKRFSLVSTVILVALGTTAPSVWSGSGIGAAWAQDDAAKSTDADREKKEERRVLKASDLDKQTLSDAYRAKAREKRHESMEFLKDMLAHRAPQGTQKAEMMLRLADLYFEEGRDIFLTEMLNYEKEYDKCFNTPGCNAELMKADNVESEKWADRSIKLYRSILQNYPQYQRADEATFYLATALQDINRRDEAVEEFTRLVRTYSESGYIPDAYVQIGEYYFDNNNAYKALLAYQKAARYKESEKYSFAMYKLAWCYYNVGEYGKSIDTMKSVVAYSMTAQDGEAGSEAAQKKRLNLQDEALKDLVRFFADAGEMDEAYNYFNKLGKKELIRDMLKRLAATYFEQGKFEQCIKTYRRLIAENPQAFEAPEYQNEIILAYQKIGRRQETLTEIKRLLETYGRASAWARANSSNQDAVNKAQDYVEKNLRTVAINYHNEAKKLGTGSQAKEVYALAYKAYSVYLQEFPDGKHSYDVRYAFGELLYKIKKFDESYEQYMKVVALDPKGQHSKFCAESAIHAADQVVEAEEKSGKGAAPGNKTAEMPLSDWEQNLLKACDQFSELYKDDKNAKNIIYKAAYLLYNHNMFKQASDRFRVVISMDPKSREAEQAANLILDSFNLVEDWQNLKEVSKAFYDQDGLGSSGFKKEVYNIYERASFKLIEINFEKSKDEGSAAVAYIAFYDEFNNSEVADLALNNSAVYFHNTGRIGDSMKARHILVDRFPKSKYYTANIAALGFDYESIADFGEAAQWYERLYNQDKTHEATGDAIYSAALFRRALGDWQAALKNFQFFITDFSKDTRVPAIKLEIAEIYDEQGQMADASRVFFNFFDKPPEGATLDQVFFARLQYGLALEKMGQQSKADKHWSDTLTAFEQARKQGGTMEQTVEFIAQIMYKRAQPQLDKYMAMGITGPGGKANRAQTDKVMKEQLLGKAKALQEVENTYAAIVKTGAGEWGLAALVQLGKAYENMSASLKGSYLPTYLTEDQADLYKMGLEDKAYLQTEKAVKVYHEALIKSFELNLYNDNTAFATRQLGVLRPDEYPVLVEELLTPRYTARARSGRSFEEQP